MRSSPSSKARASHFSTPCRLLGVSRHRLCLSRLSQNKEHVGVTAGKNRRGELFHNFQKCLNTGELLQRFPTTPEFQKNICSWVVFAINYFSKETFGRVYSPPSTGCRPGSSLTAHRRASTSREVFIVPLAAHGKLQVPSSSPYGVRARGSERSRHMRGRHLLGYGVGRPRSLT